MGKQMQDAYIVASTRTAVGKAPRGAYRSTRPDTLLAHVLQRVLAQVPAIDAKRIDDVIVGCAMPEYEQGMNVARIGLLLAGLPDSVAGMTINRFCSSGLNAVSIAADRIRTGEADIIIAAGTESMSMIPMLGRLALNEAVFAKGENVGIAYGMGITAENVAAQWKISRDDQDAFALASHQKALAAQAQRRVRRRDQRDHRPREPAGPGLGHDRHARAAKSRATKARAPTRRSKDSRSCARCSRPRVPSPPATARRCPTARARRSSFPSA